MLKGFLNENSVIRKHIFNYSKIRTNPVAQEFCTWLPLRQAYEFCSRVKIRTLNTG